MTHTVRLVVGWGTLFGMSFPRLSCLWFRIATHMSGGWQRGELDDRWSTWRAILVVSDQSELGMGTILQARNWVQIVSMLVVLIMFPPSCTRSTSVSASARRSPKSLHPNFYLTSDKR